MSALCVNCLAWHGSDTDNTLCDSYVTLPTIAHAALAALPEGERPEWIDTDVWIAGFYAGFRSAAFTAQFVAASPSPTENPQ